MAAGRRAINYFCVCYEKIETLAFERVETVRMFVLSNAEEGENSKIHSESEILESFCMQK